MNRSTACNGLLLVCLILIQVTAVYSQTPASNCGLVVNAGPDKKVCSDDPVTFLEGRVSGSGLRGFEWMPPEGLSNPRTLRPTVTVTGPQCYVLTGKKKSDVNLVTNGNFEMGATGFSTDYIPGTVSCFGLGFLDCAGTYAVLNNPQLGHVNFAACGDHTSGGGNMMVCNGAPGFVNVWCQTIPVKPDHEYCLSAWACSVNPSSPASLEFTINGSSLGTLGLSSALCLWEELTGTWNSGGASLATICIINLNTVGGGNDFAIDDIVVNELCEQYDTVCVDLVEVIAEAQDPPRICCNNPIVVLDGNGSSVGPGYTYCWTASQGGRIVAGENTLNPTVDRPGTYTLMVKGPEGCTQEVTIEVEGNLIPPRVSALSPDSLDCNNPEVRIIGGASPNNNAMFSWTGPNGFMSFDQSPNVTDTGTYILTVTDDCGCVGTGRVVVHGNANLLLIQTDTDTIDCIQDSVWLIASSNRQQTTFEWMGPMGYSCSEDSCKTSLPGWYYLTSSTEDGCEKIDSILVVADLDLPNFSVLNDTINCYSPNAQLTGVSNEQLMYSWKKDNLVIGMDSVLFTAQGGTFVLYAQGNNGCIDSLLTQVEVDTVAPSIDLLGADIPCDSSFSQICQDLTQLDSFNWSWQGGSNTTDTCIQVDQEGWYSFFARGSNGCQNIDSIFIDKKDSRPDPGFSGDTLNCDTPTDTLFSPFQNSMTTWTLPNGDQVMSDTIIVTQGGWHTFTLIADGFDCPLTDSIFYLEDFDIPQVSFSSDTLTCLRDSTFISPSSLSGIRSISWSGPNAFTSQTNRPLVRDPGVYIAIIEGENGCRDTVDIDIYQSDDFPVVSLFADTITCYSPSIDIVAASNQSDLMYAWTSPSGLTGSDSIFQADEGGTYVLAIENSMGCIIEKTIDILVDQDPPQFDILGADTLNCITRNIDFQLDILSGDIDSIFWRQNGNTAQGTPSWSTSQAGLVVVSIIGKNGCPSTDSIQILQDTLSPSINLQGDSINCINTQVTLMGQVSTMDDLLWLLPNGDTLAGLNINTSIGGWFLATSTSKNGCSTLDSIFVPVDTLAPTLDVRGDTITCINTTVDLRSNSVADSIQWIFPDQSQSILRDITTDIPGQYVIYGKNKNGCSTSDSLIVAIDTATALINLNGGVITCDSTFVTLSFTSNAQGDFIWIDSLGNDFSSDQSPTVNKAGTYTLVFTSLLNGCPSLASIRIDDFRDLPIPQYQLIQPDCDNDIGTFVLENIQGGTGPFDIFIDNTFVGQNLSRKNLDPGTHSIRIVDQNGCVSYDTIRINPIIHLSSDIDTEIEIDLGDTAWVTINNNPSPDLVRSVQWSPQEYITCDTCLTVGLFPGKDFRYQVQIIDTNGCLQLLSVLIKVNLPQVYVPNVFSPGNIDQINDSFFPFAAVPKEVTIDQMVIYSRWGERLFVQENFSPNNPDFGWNGTFNGKLMNPGVVIYHISGHYSNGETFQLAGDLTIVE